MLHLLFGAAATEALGSIGKLGGEVRSAVRPPRSHPLRIRGPRLSAVGCFLLPHGEGRLRAGPAGGGAMGRRRVLRSDRLAAHGARDSESDGSPRCSGARGGDAGRRGMPCTLCSTPFQLGPRKSLLQCFWNCSAWTRMPQVPVRIYDMYICTCICGGTNCQ